MLSSWSNGTFNMPWNPINPKNEPIAPQLVLLSRRQLPQFQRTKLTVLFSTATAQYQKHSDYTVSSLQKVRCHSSSSFYSLFHCISLLIYRLKVKHIKARYVPQCPSQPLFKAPPREAILPLNLPPPSLAMFMWTWSTRTTKLPSPMLPSLHALGHTGTPTSKANF